MDSENRNSYGTFGISASAGGTFKDSNGNDVLVDLNYGSGVVDQLFFDVHTLTGAGSYEVSTQLLSISATNDFYPNADNSYAYNNGSYTHKSLVYQDGGGFYVTAMMQDSLMQFNAFDESSDGQYVYNASKSFVTKEGPFSNTHSTVLSDSPQVTGTETSYYDAMADSFYHGNIVDSKGVYLTRIKPTVTLIYFMSMVRRE